MVQRSSKSSSLAKVQPSNINNCNMLKACKCCSKENADFLIDVGTWKEAFGTPSRFAKCLSPTAFLLIRVALFAFWFGITIWRLAEGGLHIKYLTHWTLVFECVYLFFAAFSTFMAVTGFAGIPDGKGKATPWFIQITWAMQGTALLMSVLVFLLYWVLDYRVVCASDQGCPVVDFKNIAVHGINALVMVIDLLINRQPFHLVHIFLPVIYAATYLAWNIIWQATSGDVVYMILDWEGNTSKAASVAAGVCLIVVPLFWVLCWCLANRSGRKRQVAAATTV